VLLVAGAALAPRGLAVRLIKRRDSPVRRARSSSSVRAVYPSTSLSKCTDAHLTGTSEAFPNKVQGCGAMPEAAAQISCLCTNITKFESEVKDLETICPKSFGEKPTVQEQEKLTQLQLQLTGLRAFEEAWSNLRVQLNCGGTSTSLSQVNLAEDSSLAKEVQVVMLQFREFLAHRRQVTTATASVPQEKTEAEQHHLQQPSKRHPTVAGTMPHVVNARPLRLVDATAWGAVLASAASMVDAMASKVPATARQASTLSIAAAFLTGSIVFLMLMMFAWARTEVATTTAPPAPISITLPKDVSEEGLAQADHDVGDEAERSPSFVCSPGFQRSQLGNRPGLPSQRATKSNSAAALEVPEGTASSGGSARVSRFSVRHGGRNSQPVQRSMLLPSLAEFDASLQFMGQETAPVAMSTTPTDPDMGGEVSETVSFDNIRPYVSQTPVITVGGGNASSTSMVQESSSVLQSIGSSSLAPGELVRGADQELRQKLRMVHAGGSNNSQAASMSAENSLMTGLEEDIDIVVSGRADSSSSD